MAMHDDLGKRMKENYEQIPKIKLYRRTPVIVRIDGRSFHTFTRGFDKPFDEVLIKSMQDTMQYLCEHVQGCVLGYTQSDEISLLLIDYKKLDSQAFFDYEVQKVCSITASMATLAFNKAFHNNATIFEQEDVKHEYETYLRLVDKYIDAERKGAMFDARCFNLPQEEVTNYFFWRQLDASRNSIQMVGQANFTHKELQNKSCNQIQDMLHEQKGINWNDLPTCQKRGSCCLKDYYTDVDVNGTLQRSYWRVDTEIPVFSGDGRKYVERLLKADE